MRRYAAPRTVVHFYNSTSTLQRRVVFGLDRAGVVDIAVNTAKLVHEDWERMRAICTSPTNTRRRLHRYRAGDFSVEICEAVMDVIEPTTDRKLILNLPATVEMYSPNLYSRM